MEQAQTSKYAIATIWPVFSNPQIEQDFRAANEPKNRLAITKAMLAVASYFFVFIFADANTSFADSYGFVLCLLIKSLVFVLGLLFFFCAKRINTQGVFDVAVLAFAVFFVTMTNLNVYVYHLYSTAPPGVFEASIPYAYITMLVYIFTPVTILRQLSLAAIIVIGFLCLTGWLYSFEDSRVLYSLLFLFISNSAGLTISYYVNQTLRLVWAKEQIQVEDMARLQQEIERRKRLEKDLEVLAMTDPLTGAENRRSFMRNLTREQQRCARQSAPLSIIAIDLDHFKKINDSFGHSAGDLVLQQVTKTVFARVRNTDILGRMGGEEFAVLLPNTKLDVAGNIAQELRLEIASLSLDYNQQKLSITASMGVTEYLVGESDGAFLQRADRAMYQAKRDGRNRVVQLSQ